jgi:hypothetical protein
MMSTPQNAVSIASLEAIWYDPDVQIAEREWVLDGLLPMGAFVGWIGPEKSEKSLFGMRQAMCIACGRHWNSYQCVKPRVVSYLDAENSKEDLHERYHELLKELSEDDQQLIRANFHLVAGRDLVAAGETLDHTNDTFWKKFASEHPAQVFYLDCLYMFHNKSAKDNEGLLEVLKGLRRHCGYDKCVIVLHHTRKRTDEEVGKAGRKNGVSLRKTGIRIWSDKAYGGGVFKKYADIILGQERFDQKDDDGNVSASYVDWQGYGRMLADTPMLSFESDGEHKYRRHLVTNLSQSAAKVLAEIQQLRGPWKSRHELAKSIQSCARSSAYNLIGELRIKGRIEIDGEGAVSLIRK